MTRVVHLVPTGVANVASVAAAFARLGCELATAATPTDIERAACLVLPGVGRFAAAMAALHAADLVLPLQLRLQRGQPTLGICLGMQLCCRSSDESPGVAGLGLLPGRVERFSDGVAVPQMGWNEVRADDARGLLASGHAYFANSYRLTDAPAGWACAFTDHGGPFVAAIARGHVLLTQFHPELSGDYGAALLTRWLAAAEGHAC